MAARPVEREVGSVSSRLREDVRVTDEPLPVSDELHRHHVELAGCKHPAVYEEDGVQGWCARCRAVAFGGVYEGVAYRDGKIVDAETGEALD
jgi:hypothetical protein